MNPRRVFLSRSLKIMAGASLALSWPGRLWAEGKRRILPGHLKATDLAHLNPQSIDNRNLALTPIEDFGTMGQTDLAVDPAGWRLVIDGAVERPLSLSLTELKARPVVERTVLLICPGVFSFNARWTGLSLGALLRQARPKDEANRVTIRSVGKQWPKVERFSLREVLSDEVFLAYQVNGRDLPRTHGFPLRVVAGEHYGDDWVKYVARITVSAKGKKG
ncbi:MAG: molybdopterin-dependent oxidoreductase [Proteobacteria bacterium]|nr:molybdopterin-dependent oxidoreductase [Pseudomonadota bacterium]MBU4382801.1 molybdopterin-dependent oxidoreductase [Pseudomonadota bacterium]MBU4606271.1 molybdopterin-dependent oxidoreductase [Pseudomonadota bacterium]MCG2765316.1 molybdopterin-dependent oxidoreductase [Desulfarculaceae bacterium]